MPKPSIPVIVVCGVELTSEQTVAVQLAIDHTAATMRSHVGQSLLGKEIAQTYENRLHEVLSIIVMRS